MCTGSATKMRKPCQSLYADIVNDFGTESSVHLNPAGGKKALQVTISLHGRRGSLSPIIGFFFFFRPCVLYQVKKYDHV